VLVGNKCDYRDGAMDTRAEVPAEDAANFAKQLELPVVVFTYKHICAYSLYNSVNLCKYFESSAANNLRVEDPFKYIAAEFRKRYEDTVAKAEELASTTA
jgi:Ras family